MELSDATIEQAEHRMQQRLASGPYAVAARYDRRVSRIMVTLSNGLELAFPPHLAEGLAHAQSADLAVIEITPAGLGLHWPRADADLYVPALLNGIFGSPRWMAGLLGSSRGLARSDAGKPTTTTSSRKHGRRRGTAAG